MAGGSPMHDPGTVATLRSVDWNADGKLDLMIEGRLYTVGPGDSFRIRGEAHEWINPYDEPAVAIWVIAPPVY